MREAARSLVMTTPGPTDRHRHCSLVDTDGNGYTTPGADGHRHQIIGLEVMRAPDGHAHELSAQRCNHEEHQTNRCV